MKETFPQKYNSLRKLFSDWTDKTIIKQDN